MIHSQADILEGKYKLIMWGNTAFQTEAPCKCTDGILYIIYFSNGHLFSNHSQYEIPI